MQMKTTMEIGGRSIIIDVTPYSVRPGHHVRFSMRGANGTETTLLDDEDRHAIIAFLSLVPDTPKD